MSFYLFLIFICSSCMKIHKLTNDDMLWTNMYNKGDTVVFVGLNNIADTLIITDYSFDSLDNTLPIDENYIFSDFYCGASISGLFIHNLTKQEISFFCQKINDNNIELSMFVGNDCYDCDTIKDDYKKRKNDYVIFDFDDKTKKDENNAVVSFQKIKWVKGKGMMEYKL